MTNAGGRGGSGSAKGVSVGATLSPAASAGELAAGRWLAAPGFVYAWPTATLCYTGLFGEPSREDFERLAELFARELAPPAQPHASIIDATRIERADAHAFEVLSAYVARTRDDMARWVMRLAIVRPGGFVGALAAGFYEAIDPPYPVQVFDDPAAAFEWVGARALAAPLGALVDEQAGDPHLLELRRVLVARLPETDVEGCAAALGTSVRTLQRRLREADTTYGRELTRAQVEVACRWLGETDEPISRIAYEVGFSSPQRLSAAFRKTTGQTPTAFRRDRGVGPTG